MLQLICKDHLNTDISMCHLPKVQNAVATVPHHCTTHTHCFYYLTSGPMTAFYIGITWNKA